MKRNYNCTICKKKFSRRWNANRHNNTIHAGLSIIYDNETGVRINSKQPYHANSTVKGEEPETNEKLILDIVGKMLQPFEELEILYIHKSEHEKIKNLSELLVEALSTSNPVRALNDALEYQRSLRAKIKFIEYISTSMNVHSNIAASHLTDLIKRNRYYKKKAKIEY